MQSGAHLFVRLVDDVDAVDFDDAVAELEAGGIGGRAGIDFADVLTAPALVGQQVETEPVALVPLDDVAQSRRRRRAQVLPSPQKKNNFFKEKRRRVTYFFFKQRLC